MVNLDEKKLDNSNFGIHILKFLAIFFQIEVHAYNWLSVKMQVTAESFSSVWETKILLAKGGFSTLVPITAAAVLRMGLPLAPGENKLPARFSLRPYFMLCFFLMLVESTKEMLVYGPWGFFSWNALHLISLTFIVILFVMQYSVWLLWPISVLIFLLTPLAIKFVDSNNITSESVYPWLTVNLCFFLFFSMLAATIARIYAKNSAIPNSAKKRGYTLIGIIWLIISLLCFFLPQNFAKQDMILKLPEGILAGTAMGNHIWGFFPWAGMMIVGFIIYDVLIRMKASRVSRWVMVFLGVLLATIFYVYFSDEVMDNCSGQRASLGFSAVCFNRTPIQILLTIAIFLMVTPLSVWAEKLGLEFRFVRAVSKSILWIYLYETSVLVWLAPIWIKYVPEADRVYSFTLFALASSAAIAILLDRFQYRVSVTLKKSQD